MASSTALDADVQLELLRRFAPVLRLATGERFTPVPVEPYLAACSLRVRRHDGSVHELVPAGSLELAELEGHSQRGAELFLQFADGPLKGESAELVRQTLRQARQGVIGGGLARVGLLGRLIDAFFHLSLGLRGSVPAGTADAALAKAHELGLHERPTYYGRVVRHGGWLVLHYLYFYAMNDWRSSFGGANDHEADWEQVLVYLEERADGAHVPAWVAYAAHDVEGDDLRRHWLDPEVQKVGEHPVAYVAAGSHAAYFQAGEYLTRVDIPLLRPLFRVRGFLRRLARLRRREVAEELLLRVPYVDIADGGGETVGAGGTRKLDAVLLDERAPWVADFHGLWGLDTADVTGGERAPAGPKFERDGSVRRSWADPVGFAGMHKVTPGPLTAGMRELRAEAAEAEAAQVEAGIDATLTELRGHALAVASGAARSRRAELARLESALGELYARRVELRDEARRLRAPPPVPAPEELRAHLRRPPTPEPLEPSWRRVLLGTWAALSVPLILGTLAVLVVLPNSHWLIIEVGVLGGLLAVERIISGRLVGLAALAGGLALLWALALALVNYGRLAGALVLGALALVVLVGNLRELLRR